MVPHTALDCLSPLLLLPIFPWIPHHGVVSSKMSPSLWPSQPTTLLKMREMHRRKKSEDGVHCALLLTQDAFRRATSCSRDHEQNCLSQIKPSSRTLELTLLVWMDTVCPSIDIISPKTQRHSLRRQVGCFSLTLLNWPTASTSRDLTPTDHMEK